MRSTILKLPPSVRIPWFGLTLSLGHGQQDYDKFDTSDEEVQVHKFDFSGTINLHLVQLGNTER